MFCNRAIYHKGWTAVTRHGVPWLGAYKRSFDEDVWELYDTNSDWTQAHDLAKEHPKKLAELQRLFLNLVDGKPVGRGRVEQTVPMAFSADETCDVGQENGSPVSADYGPTGNEFYGEVNWVQIDLEKDDHDHTISPDERFKIAMARQ
jgi:hypothetical protein